MNQDPIAGMVAQGAVVPRGRSDETQFEGVALLPKPELIRGVLDEYIASHAEGEAAAGAFIERFETELNHRWVEHLDMSGGTPPQSIQLEIDRDKKILGLLRSELEALRAEDEELLSLFEVRAAVLLDRLLAANEMAVLRERFHYRLDRTATTVTSWHVDEDGQWYSEDETTYSYSMPASPECAGLAATVGDLVAKLKDLRAKTELQAEASQPSYIDASTRGVRDDRARALEAPYYAAMAETDESLRKYDLARLEAETRYPVLAAFTRVPRAASTATIDEVREGLEVLAGAPTPAAAEKLYVEIAERISNAEKVRDALDDEDLTVWNVESVVELTKLGLDVKSGSRFERVVDDRVNAVAAAKRGREEALGMVALALGLLAMPLTGGASLSLTAAFIAGAAAVGQLGITAYLTVEHLQGYRVQKAQAGTYFDQAQALSQEDPSMGWLAWDLVDLAFGSFDFVGAFRGLSRTLRPVIAARREARTAQQIIAANEQLAKAKAKIEAEYAEKLASLERSEKLASRVTEKAKAIAEEQAQALAEATKNWKQSLDEATQSLVESPALKKTFDEMDPEVRAVLTRCGD